MQELFQGFACCDLVTKENNDGEETYQMQFNAGRLVAAVTIAVVAAVPAFLFA